MMAMKKDNSDIKKLERLLADVQEAYVQKSFDKESPDYRNKVSKMVNDHFVDMINKISESKNARTIRERSYLNGEVLRKRRKVTTAYCMKTAERFQDHFENICIEEEFSLLMSTVNSENYDMIDCYNFISEAAAIYILDNISYSDMDEMMKYLPRKEEEIAMAICNDEVTDACHSDELIRSLVYLIQNQERSLKKHDELTMYLEDAMVSGRAKEANESDPPESLNENQKLLRIISLINPIRINRAIRHFEDDVLRYLEIVFGVLNDYQKEYNKEKKAVLQLINRQMQKRKSSLLMARDPMESDEMEEVFKAAAGVQKMNDVLDRQSEFLYDAIHLYTFLYEISDQEGTEKLKALEIDNPFETCFVFAYLYTVNDDLIYLPNLMIPMLKIAAEKLPWSKDVNPEADMYDFEEEEDTEDEEDTEEEEETEDEEEAEKRRIELIKEIAEQMNENRRQSEELEKDFYSFRYNDSVRFPGRQIDPELLQKLNLPQVVFDLTGVVLPRDVYSNSGMKEELLASGFKEDQTRLFELFLQTVDALKQRTDFDLVETRQEEEDDHTKDEVVSIEERNKKLSEENKRLKQLIFEKNKVIEEQKNKVRKLETEAEKQDRELSSLRRFVESLDPKDTAKEETVALPYRVSGKVLIFGGSVSWQNQIKELLDSVRVTDVDKLPDVNAIRYADEIWIQTRTFSHAHYNRVMQAVRTYDKQVSYFAFSGAEKCALQLAKEDQRKRGKKK